MKISNQQLKRYRLIPLIIYLIGLGITLSFALLNDYTTSSDSGRQYLVYLNIIETGKWIPNPEHILLSSCLTTTYIPAMLQRLTGFDPLMVFKIFPSILIPILPVTVFLIAQRFTEYRLAIFASLFLISQICFLWSPMYGRVIVALLFFSLIIWTLFKDNIGKWQRITLLAVFSMGVVFSHYTTTFISIYILGVGFTITCLAQRRLHIHLGLALVFLIIGTLLWYGLAYENSGTSPLKMGMGFTNRVTGLTVIPEYPTPIIVQPSDKPTASEPTTTKSPRIFDISSSEEVVQVAFGKTFPIMNTPQRIEFVASWITIILMSLGLVISIKKRLFPANYLALAIAAYTMILLGIALPYLSDGYGIARIYFSALLILSMFFAIGATFIARWLRLPQIITTAFILLIFSLCTSGIMHNFFGLSR